MRVYIYIYMCVQRKSLMATRRKPDTVEGQEEAHKGQEAAQDGHEKAQAGQMGRRDCKIQKNKE